MGWLDGLLPSDDERANLAGKVRGGMLSYLNGANAMVPQTNADAAQALAYATPGVGNVMSAKDAYNSANQGDWGRAAVGAFGAVPLIGGMFGGALAKTADHAALARAGEMAAAGHAPAAIWNETGWFQGADNKWRFEIPDNEAGLSGKTTGAATRFNDINHPEFKAAYDPNGYQIKGIAGKSFPDGGEGSYVGSMSSGVPAKISASGPNNNEVLTTILHELQHHVQAKEGFEPGGNPWVDASLRWQNEGVSPGDIYQRLAGEVEARNVEKRMNMTPEQRRASPPWETQDVPFSMQITRGVR